MRYVLLASISCLFFAIAVNANAANLTDAVNQARYHDNHGRPVPPPPAHHVDRRPAPPPPSRPYVDTRPAPPPPRHNVDRRPAPPPPAPTYNIQVRPAPPPPPKR